MQKLLFLAPLLLLLAGCGEPTTVETTTTVDTPPAKGASSDASKPEVDTPPAMMRVEYYQISKK